MLYSLTTKAHVCLRHGAGTHTKKRRENLEKIRVLVTLWLVSTKPHDALVDQENCCHPRLRVKLNSPSG
jgi:hypothetical protein